MIIIRLGKNSIRLALCFILFIMAFVLIGSIFESNNRVSAKTFLSSAKLMDEGRKIEIFDIAEGKVIAKIQPSRIIVDEAASFLGKITGLYAKVKALPDSGQIIRIPFEPEIKAKGKWITDSGITSIHELYVLFPSTGEPYLLILDEKERPWFFNFNADTTNLLHYLNVKNKT